MYFLLYCSDVEIRNINRFFPTQVSKCVSKTFIHCKLITESRCDVQGSRDKLSFQRLSEFR